MRTTDEKLTSLVRGSLPENAGEFRPCAFFDERLDCIRVVTRDCSVLEERINAYVTVLIDNYYPEPGRKQYVGFTIKGARHFCKQSGLALAAPMKLSQVIDALIASSPDVVVQWFVDVVAKPLIEEESLDHIDITDGSLSAA